MSSNFWWTRKIWIERRFFSEEFNVLISIFKSTVKMLLCGVFLRYLSLFMPFFVNYFNNFYGKMYLIIFSNANDYQFIQWIFGNTNKILRNAKDLRALTWMIALNHKCLTSLRIKSNHGEKQLFLDLKSNENIFDWLVNFFSKRPFTTVKFKFYYKNQE